MSGEDLIGFIESVSGDCHLAVEENLGEGFVRLKTAEAERRQARHDIRCVEDIVIEMLRNARDAHAESIYLATSREGRIKTLVLLDDGDGVPADMQEMIFEPRVTSKLETMVMDSWGVHGRGMALYGIRSNTSAARIVKSAPGMGSSFSVTVDLDALDEKADQSSLPVLARDEGGDIVVASGPHNVNRTVVEFALEAKDKVKVYVGSPAEICATLVETGRDRLARSSLLFCDDIEELPVVLRPAAAADAAELAEVCQSIGLDMSDRTAHRVLAGDISPCEPLLEQLAESLQVRDAVPGRPDIYRDNRGLKLSTEDISEFSRTLKDAFSPLSQRYYIELTDEPIIRVGKDAITVRFPFDKEM